MISAGQEVVIGYCRYNHKQGLADRLIAYDNLLRGLRYLSATLAHHPYAGDGRNLSYPRKLFFQHKGFSSSLYLNRGDDDLFINEIANSKNTQASLNPESHTTMARYDSLKLWFERKASLVATQQYYKGYQVGTYRFDTAFYYLFNIAGPLLAHPERYKYMDENKYRQLKERGVLFQLNLGAIVGGYSPETQTKAKKILQNGWYDCIGSDIHSFKQLKQLIGIKALTSKEIILYHIHRLAMFQ